MKTTVTLEFDSPDAAAQFLAGQGGAASAPAPAPAPATAGVSQADFSAAVQNYAKAHSPKATKAKLAEFGYGKVGDVPADQYAALIPHLAVG